MVRFVARSGDEPKPMSPCKARIRSSPQSYRLAQSPPITILASPTSGHQVCERDGDLSLINRVPEHEALVARTDVKIILADVHTACKVGTLLHLAISVI